MKGLLLTKGVAENEVGKGRNQKADHGRQK
jgi:hypothetical protein